VAVADRDREHFEREYGVGGFCDSDRVDLAYFTYGASRLRPTSGWKPCIHRLDGLDANVDGVASSWTSLARISRPACARA